jgi:hypothetical protein
VNQISIITNILGFRGRQDVVVVFIIDDDTVVDKSFRVDVLLFSNDIVMVKVGSSCRGVDCLQEGLK